ncbi:molybdopterin dinucleotide binding domain-containing protein [Streptomyces sp. NPDC005531]
MWVEISEADAATQDLAEGDLVEVRSPRGALRGRLRRASPGHDNPRLRGRVISWHRPCAGRCRRPGPRQRTSRTGCRYRPLGGLTCRPSAGASPSARRA